MNRTYILICLTVLSLLIAGIAPVMASTDDEVEDYRMYAGIADGNTVKLVDQSGEVYFSTDLGAQVDDVVIAENSVYALSDNKLYQIGLNGEIINEQGVLADLKFIEETNNGIASVGHNDDDEVVISTFDYDGEYINMEKGYDVGGYVLDGEMYDVTYNHHQDELFINTHWSDFTVEVNDDGSVDSTVHQITTSGTLTWSTVSNNGDYYHTIGSDIGSDNVNIQTFSVDTLSMVSESTPFGSHSLGYGDSFDDGKILNVDNDGMMYIADNHPNTNTLLASNQTFVNGVGNNGVAIDSTPNNTFVNIADDVSNRIYFYEIAEDYEIKYHNHYEGSDINAVDGLAIEFDGGAEEEDCPYELAYLHCHNLVPSLVLIMSNQIALGIGLSVWISAQVEQVSQSDMSGIVTFTSLMFILFIAGVLHLYLLITCLSLAVIMLIAKINSPNNVHEGDI